METKKLNELKDSQYSLQREIVNATGINIVTCGDCGQVLLHRVEEQEIICNECGFTSEPCDFPDLNY
jgi:predicted RNA-binding Zn-ribbon protein involved in translation (DUF1610 family)